MTAEGPAKGAVSHHGRQPQTVVVTWFTSTQVGFLDFRYRVQSLLRRGETLVASNRAEAAERLGVPAGQFILLPSGPGLVGFLRLLRAARRLCQRTRAEQVVLLHSALAPLCWLLGDCATVLYWNEHPSHLYPADKPGWLGRFRNGKDLLLRRLSYASARRAGLVMPIGEHHQADLLTHGCNRHRLRMIYMGVDDAFLHPRPARPRIAGASSLLRLVYTGAVHPDRGRDLMIEAVARANRAGCRVTLLMVGATEEQRLACQALTSQWGVTERVTVIGRLPGRKIRKILWQADAGLCLWADKPYWRFNPPTKLFEYLVAGLPVLANDIRTHTRYVRHGENGLICAYDPVSLAAQIRFLAGHPEQRRAMADKAAAGGRQYRWSVLEPHFLAALSGPAPPAAAGNHHGGFAGQGAWRGTEQG